jgi:hypothetical protein
MIMQEGQISSKVNRGSSVAGQNQKLARLDGMSGLSLKADAAAIGRESIAPASIHRGRIRSVIQRLPNFFLPTIKILFPFPEILLFIRRPAR